MLLSILVTIFSLLGVLATLLTAGLLGFYFSRVPTGDSAMGLIIPFFTAAAATIAALLASLFAAWKGGLDWTTITRPTGFLILLLAGAFVSTAIFGAFLAWAERHPFNNPFLLNFSGLILPIIYFIFLTVIAWRDPASRTNLELPKFLAGASTLAVLAGLISAVLFMHAIMQKHAQDHARMMESLKAQQVEASRLAEMTPEARLLEKLAIYSPDAPLWTLTAGLPEESSLSLRKIWIERALTHPNFDNELQGTITCDYAIYRHGCTRMLSDMPADRLKPIYADWLATDATLTAADITKHANLATHDHDNLSDHAQAIATASTRFAMTDQLRAALTTLRAAVTTTPENLDRTATIHTLDTALIKTP